MASTQIKLLALALVAGLSFYASAGNPPDQNDCDNTSEPLQDPASFAKLLSPYARALFTRLSPDQQERALSYTHESTISPDDAVVQVSSECKKIK